MRDELPSYGELSREVRRLEALVLNLRTCLILADSKNPANLYKLLEPYKDSTACISIMELEKEWDSHPDRKYSEERVERFRKEMNE